jgi:cell wall-associated NlpC family hydrolase
MTKRDDSAPAKPKVPRGNFGNAFKSAFKCLSVMAFLVDGFWGAGLCSEPMSGNTLKRSVGSASRLGMVTLVLACGGAFAAPDASDASDDPLARFIAERGAASAAPVPAAGPVERTRDQAADMVLAALNFLDVPYRRGGNDVDAGFDCSGFTRHVFGLSLGLALPRRVDEQASARGLVKVRRSELKPGDLVFFNTLKRTFSHVGIYIGEGRFIHAPRSGAQVRVESMRTAYWKLRYTGARRAETLLAAAPAAAIVGDAPVDPVAETMRWLH